MKVFVVCGKARSGKDIFSNVIRDYYKVKGTNSINLQFSSYIKEYAKKISNWDGADASKPRELLQELGTEVIRNKIDPLFFVKRIIDDVKVYSNYFDVITISDARTKVEVDNIKNTFDNVCVIRIVRPNFDNGLTKKQQQHFTEVDLDDYKNFDYTIINDGNIEKLEKEFKKIVEVIK